MFADLPSLWQIDFLINLLYKYPQNNFLEQNNISLQYYIDLELK